MKDNFSTQSDQYAKFRPSYPDAFFEFLKSRIQGFELAWDCGTGNGQVAAELAGLFQQVYATDISQAQLDQAIQLPNINYSLQPAEQTNFPDQFFDLILVAQAIHWFDFERFYSEVRRTAKEGASLVVIGYGKIEVNATLDQVIGHLYHDIVGPYWDPERKYIDDRYQTIPFPFTEMDTPKFEHRLHWNFDQLIGYLGTWSAVKHYEKANGINPVEAIRQELARAWGAVPGHNVEFPLLLRMGDVGKGGSEFAGSVKQTN